MTHGTDRTNAASIADFFELRFAVDLHKALARLRADGISLTPEALSDELVKEGAQTRPNPAPET